MPFLQELMIIVGAPQWNFLYHLAVLFGIEAGLGISYGHWRRSRQPEALRLMRGLAALLMLRLIPLAFAALARAGNMGDLLLLPPLERALDVAALTVIVWLVLASSDAVKSLATPLLWTNLGLVVLGYAALTRLWTLALAGDATLTYSAFWQRYVWAGWQILLCLAGVYAMVGRKVADRRVGLWLTLFAVALAGQVAEIVVPLGGTHVAAWTRLAHLIEYPLLAVIMYKIAIEDTRHRRPDLFALPSSSTLGERLLELFEATALAPDSDEPAESQEALALRAVRFMAGALGVDQAAVGLLEGAKQDRMRLVAVYNPRRQGRSGEVVSFPLEEQRSISRALHRQETVQVGGADDILQVKFLYSLMGSSETGPLLIQPLSYRGQTVGVFICGNGDSKQPFSDVELRLSKVLADIVAQLLVAPRVVGRLERDLQERGQLLSVREAEWGRRLESVDQELQQERSSAQLFAQRLADLEREQQQREAEIDRASRRLLLQEEETRRSQQEAAALGRKIDSLALDKARLEDEIGGYREQIRGLEQLLKEGK